MGTGVSDGNLWQHDSCEFGGLGLHDMTCSPLADNKVLVVSEKK